MLSHLRSENIAGVRGGVMRIEDLDRLVALAGFNPAYLQGGVELDIRQRSLGSSEEATPLTAAL